jgi:hypothetical protein
MAQERKNELIAAMKALGYQHGRVSICMIGHYALVKLDGEYFGMWNTRTATFED